MNIHTLFLYNCVQKWRVKGTKRGGEGGKTDILSVSRGSTWTHIVFLQFCTKMKGERDGKGWGVGKTDISHLVCKHGVLGENFDNLILIQEYSIKVGYCG